jgi:serine phosphatase RsbU (regulator of sigma subunit)
MSPENEEYGPVRLEKVVRANSHASPERLIGAVFDDLDAYNTVRFDDQTVVVMKVKSRRSRVRPVSVRPV